MNTSKSVAVGGAVVRSFALLLCWLAPLAFLCGPVTASPPETIPERLAHASQAHVSAAYRQLPLSFEANQGQTDPQVKYLARGDGYTLFLTTTDAILALGGSNPGGSRTKPRFGPSPRQHPGFNGDSLATVRIALMGANREAQLRGLEELPGRGNYFIGNDPKKWRTEVPTYAKVTYTNVYPGVDLVYYGNQRQLEYDFLVSPGADTEVIRLGFQGVDKLEINEQGELVLCEGTNRIRFKKPAVYQESHGLREEVAGDYVIKGKHQVGFQVISYDPAKQLVIDSVLVYSSYLGGSGSNSGRGIAVDAVGNTYLTGATTSTNFPITSGVLQKNLGGVGSNSVGDAYVVKLDSSGTSIVYSTYIGGVGDDAGASIAVDSSGNAYVSGATSSSSFPTTLGAFQTTFGGSGSSAVGDAFVFKLSASGSALLYSTYLGGTDDDVATGIAIDATGNAYVTGITSSANFPTATPLQSALRGRSDAFVAKLNAAGSALIYSTYLGGAADENGFAIAVDVSGNAYLAGSTTSSDFPTTSGAFQQVLGGPSDGVLGDGFVTKLNPSGSSLLYSTYLGGSGDDGAFGIAVDASGNAYLTGATSSVNFPTARPLQSALRGSGDAFIAKLNATGAALIYSSYLGGSSFDAATAIAVDTSGSVFVTGFTNSSDFPLANPVQSVFGDTGCAELPGEELFRQLAGKLWSVVPVTLPCGDAFVARTNAAGTSILLSTYLGGAAGDIALRIATDNMGNAYVTGTTSSSNLPTATAFQGSLAGAQNAFVAKIGSTITPACTPPPSQMVGWWPGDGNANDIVGTNNSTLQNGATFAAGMVGQAFSLDGMGAFVKIPSPIIDVRSPYSLDAWIFLNTELATGANWAILNKDQRLSGGPVDLGFGVTSKFGKLRNLVLDAVGGSQVGVFSQGQIPLNQWTHVAATFDGATSVSFYINGQLDSTVSQAAGSNSASGWQIGGGTTGEFFNGLIDEVEIFNRALTSAEIQAIFAARSTGKCKKPTGTNATPQINQGGVVNGGSFLPGIASGTWITIQGSGLSANTRTWNNSDFNGNQLPTKLDGVSVTVNGLRAYVYYISPTQLNVLSPDDPTLGPVPVQVTTPQGSSNIIMANKGTFSPAFFLFLPTQYAAAVHANGTYLGKPNLFPGVTTTPAKPGETILLFGTGFGLTNPPLPSGQIVTQAARLANPVTILIGGKQANVSFAGLSASGEDQFNVTVPADLPDGDTSLVAEVGGATSQSNVFITVQRTTATTIHIDSIDSPRAGAALPLSLLTINGSGFDPSASQTVRFFDDQGFAVDVPVVDATTSSLTVAAPPVLEGGQFRAKPVNIQVFQPSGAGSLESNVVRGFQMGGLPSLTLPPGAVTSNFLSFAAGFSQNLQSLLAEVDVNSHGQISTATVQAQLQSMRSELLLLRDKVQSSMRSNAAATNLKHLRIRDATLEPPTYDVPTLQLSDQFFIASGQQAMTVSAVGPGQGNCTTLNEGLKDILGSLTPQQRIVTAEEIHKCAEEWRRAAASLSAGALALSAVGVGSGLGTPAAVLISLSTSVPAIYMLYRSWQLDCASAALKYDGRVLVTAETNSCATILKKTLNESLTALVLAVFSGKGLEKSGNLWDLSNQVASLAAPADKTFFDLTQHVLKPWGSLPPTSQLTQVPPLPLQPAACSSLTAQPDLLTLGLNDTGQITVSQSGASFSSSDTSVATVDSQGIVRGIGKGVAAITVSAPSSSCTAQVGVGVAANTYTGTFTVEASTTGPNDPNCTPDPLTVQAQVASAPVQLMTNRPLETSGAVSGILTTGPGSVTATTPSITCSVDGSSATTPGQTYTVSFPAGSGISSGTSDGTLVSFPAPGSAPVTATVSVVGSNVMVKLNWKFSVNAGGYFTTVTFTATLNKQ